MSSQFDTARNVADAAAYRASQVLAAQAAAYARPSECWAQYKGHEAAEQAVRIAGYEVALVITTAYAYPDRYTERDAWLAAHNAAYNAAYNAVIIACVDGSRTAAETVIDEIRSRYVKL